MATPTVSPLAPTAPPQEPAAPCAVPRASGRLAGWLLAVTDPEWPLFLAVLLAPAALALALGDGQKASFFFGVAAYVAVLKWLGWLVFGRLAPARPRFLLFPAEIFAGLAVVCAWFYLRNLAAKLWPGSYGLAELAFLFPALLVLHAAALALRAPALLASCRMSFRPTLAALGERLAMYAPFAALLTVALWSISTALGVQGTDAMTYTFLARIYRSEGIDFAVPPANAMIVYPSAFAAMNATAATLAPLSVVQAFHLQHVLLCVTALFLVTGTVAALAGRPLPLLHSLPAPLLFLFPLYALYPDVFYPGTPKQVGPPLCAAVCLLSLLAPVAGRGAFFLAAGLVGLLAVLAAALNPACVPYALASIAVAWVVLAVRGRAGLGLPRWQAVAVPAGLALVAAGLVFGCDLYYRGLLRSLLPSGAEPAATGGPEAAPAAAARPPRFSWATGMRGLGSVNPVGLTPLDSTTALVWERADHLKGWTAHWPALALTVGTLAVSLCVLAELVSRQKRAAALRDPLVRFVLVALLLWPGLKYAMTIGIGGLSRADHETGLLSVYLRYLLLRCELLLLFACLAAAGARLFLTWQPRFGRGARRVAVGSAAVVACWLLPALGLWAGVEVGGFVEVPTNRRFPVTEDELKMAAWVGENVPPEKGTVGLAAWTFTVGHHDEEHHIYPLGGGHALVVYGKKYNFRFFLPALEGDGGAAYEKYVRDDFDARWCLKNNVRYFYATPDGLAKNPGLAKAVGRGTLRPLHREGDSCVYELVGE